MDIIENNQIVLDGFQFKINAFSGCGLYPKIMESIWNQLKASLSHHNKVAVLRFDLHVSTGCEVSSRDLSYLIDRLKRHVASVYGTSQLGYVWVREQDKASSPHYHLCLFVNGNRLQNSTELFKWISDRWQALGHPRPHNTHYSSVDGKKGTYNRGAPVRIIRRSKGLITNWRILEETVYWLSYLAKVRTKTRIVKGARLWGSSRLTMTDRLDLSLRQPESVASTKKALGAPVVDFLSRLVMSMKSSKNTLLQPDRALRKVPGSPLRIDWLFKGRWSHWRNRSELENGHKIDGELANEPQQRVIFFSMMIKLKIFRPLTI